MRLLLDLAEHAGEVVSIDDLLDRVWSGVTVTPDSVYQAVASLRRVMEDDPKEPRYIATVPRLGYRLTAAVGPWEDVWPARASLTMPTGRRIFLAAAALGAIALVGAVYVYGQSAHARRAAVAAATRQPIAVGVLPFLDLTDTMDNEPFADDLTEGVIDELSRNPLLQTPSLRSSLYLKGKKITPIEAAKALGVAYVVDGSVHAEGARFWVIARLIRADNGFVVWSQSYDRSTGGIPALQEIVSADVAKALASDARRAQS